MGKVSVRKCDVCGQLDSEGLRVKRVTVVGPRFDLCATCRVKVLLMIRNDVVAVIRYVAEQDGAVDEVDPDQLRLTDATADMVGAGEPTAGLALVPSSEVLGGR